MSSSSNTRLKQLLLAIAGVLVLALILWLPEHKAQETGTSDSQLISESNSTHDDAAHEHEHSAESEAGGESHSQELPEELKAEFTTLSDQANKVVDVETKLALYDSLIQLSIENNLPPFVAKYTKEKAKAVPTETNWLLSGDNYFKAFRLSKNQSKPMIEGAIASYSQVLELNPDNLKAKTALGVAYVEGAAILGEMPMKGIGMLKEVINIDPENVDALTNLGYFAIQSGQYEKAIERFKQILEIDPENAEAYIYLTDVYLSQNQVDKGIETLEQYKSLVSDPLVKQQVDDYIEELKNK